jgi:hypothetical protein
MHLNLNNHIAVYIRNQVRFHLPHPPHTCAITPYVVPSSLLCFCRHHHPSARFLSDMYMLSISLVEGGGIGVEVHKIHTLNFDCACKMDLGHQKSMKTIIGDCDFKPRTKNEM